MPIGQPDEMGYDFGGMQFGQQQQQPPAGIRAGGWGTVNRTSSISDLMGMASSVGGPSMNLQQMMRQGNPRSGMQLPVMRFGAGDQGSLPGMLKEMEDDTEPSILEHDEEFVQQQAQSKVMRTLGPMMQGGGQMGGPQFSPPGGYEQQAQAPEPGPVQPQQQGGAMYDDPGNLSGLDMQMGGGEASGF